MDAAAELGRNNPISTRFSLSMEMSSLTRDGTAETVSRDQILRHERGQGNIIFSCCSADHEQDWQPYPVDPYSCYMCDHNMCDHVQYAALPIYPGCCDLVKINNDFPLNFSMPAGVVSCDRLGHVVPRQLVHSPHPDRISCLPVSAVHVHNIFVIDRVVSPASSSRKGD